jgi:hypothetical protein
MKIGNCEVFTVKELMDEHDRRVALMKAGGPTLRIQGMAETYDDIGHNDSTAPPHAATHNWWWDEKNECICVNDRREFYYVRREEFTSPLGLVHWLAHLEQKRWMSNEALGELVRHMLDHCQFNPFTGTKE